MNKSSGQLPTISLANRSGPQVMFKRWQVVSPSGNRPGDPARYGRHWRVVPVGHTQTIVHVRVMEE